MKCLKHARNALLPDYWAENTGHRVTHTGEKALLSSHGGQRGVEVGTWSKEQVTLC